MIYNVSYSYEGLQSIVLYIFLLRIQLHLSLFLRLNFILHWVYHAIYQYENLFIGRTHYMARRMKAISLLISHWKALQSTSLASAHSVK